MGSYAHSYIVYVVFLFFVFILHIARRTALDHGYTAFIWLHLGWVLDVLEMC
jgi:hypothetical protein